MGALFGSVMGKEVRLPPVRFLRKTYDGLSAMVRPSSSDPRIPWKVLLGTDVVLDRRLTLDFSSMTAEAGSRPSKAVPGLRLPLRFRSGRPYVRATFGGRPVFAMIDTGSPLCELDSRVIGIRARETRTEPITDGTGARSVEPVFRGPTLRVGGRRFGAPEFFRSPLRGLESRSRPRCNFVLGANVMIEAAGSWTFDRPQGWLGWTG